MKKVLLLVFLFSISLGDTRKTLYEGLDSKIEIITDDMTDEKTGVIFVHFSGPLYMAIYGPDEFALFPESDNLIFHYEAEHLIRVGKSKPYVMKNLKNQEALKLINNNNARPVITSLLDGDTVKVRFYEWPSYDENDITIATKSLGYIYGKVVDLFGWEDLGVPRTLPPVKLEIFEHDDIYLKGWATANVDGNKDLIMQKIRGASGDGCYITINSELNLHLFGYQNNEWTIGRKSALLKGSIIIYDENNNIVFNKKVPKYENHNGTKWTESKGAAMIAWNNSPDGSIEFSSHISDFRESLYGYKELWEWGVSKGCLPSIAP